MIWALNALTAHKHSSSFPKQRSEAWHIRTQLTAPSIFEQCLVIFCCVSGLICKTITYCGVGLYNLVWGPDNAAGPWDSKPLFPSECPLKPPPPPPFLSRVFHLLYHPVLMMLHDRFERQNFSWPQDELIIRFGSKVALHWHYNICVLTHFDCVAVVFRVYSCGPKGSGPIKAFLLAQNQIYEAQLISRFLFIVALCAQDRGALLSTLLKHVEQIRYGMQFKFCLWINLNDCIYWLRGITHLPGIITFLSLFLQENN